MAELFSDEWLQGFVTNANAGAPESLKKAKTLDYWEIVDKMGQSFSAPMAMVLKADEAHGLMEPKYALLNFEQGKVTEAHLCSREEASAAPFILQTDVTGWKRCKEGSMDVTQAVMYRNFLLTKGDIDAFFRIIYFFVEWLRAGIQQTEMSFPSKAAA